VATSTANSQRLRFAVLGAGHGGLAMSGHLALMGFPVALFNRSEARIWGVKSRGGVEVEGEVDGFGRLDKVTTDMRVALQDAEIVMVVVPASGHRVIAELCAPHLKDGQVVVLNPGRTCGALEFRQVLLENNCHADVIIAEAQTLIYACRAIGPGHARIFSIKNSIPLATIRAHRTPEALKLIRQAFPQFVPGDNIFKTSFDNIGSIFHPVIAVMNTGWIEDLSDFQFYVQGCSRSVAAVLERLDAERVAVAEALGIRATTAREWLYLAYAAVGRNLYDAMHDNPGYRGILAPSNMDVRYLTEDVPYSLVPMSSLGDLLGVPTPGMKAFIQLASAMHNVDYAREGRTVEKLGLAGMSVKQLRLLAIGEQ